MDIVIASGKGGTGKTFVATNLAVTIEGMGKDVKYFDCDVEEPDGHLFLEPDLEDEIDVTLVSPSGVDPDRCIAYGKCVEACTYNAIAMVEENVLFFPELCHVCGACSLVCPTDAIVEEEKTIGTLYKGKRENIEVYYAALETGEGGMSPRLIKKVKEERDEGINIIDSPPGTACSAVESVAGADLVVLITDPTPFGINDLKLSVEMCRKIGLEPVVLVNRAEYRDHALREYCEEAELEIVGEIPDEREIAEVYSSGDLVVEEIPEYKGLFEEIGEEIRRIAKEEREVKEVEEITDVERGENIEASSSRVDSEQGGEKAKQLVIISGKGGTGKTSLTGAFAALSSPTTVADCDVDAADLHLITDPDVKEKGSFSGGYTAEIDQDSCVQCGRCEEECRFDAVEPVNGKYYIDELECEGCGVCDIVCEYDAVELEKTINGSWFVSETRLGPMAHAELGIAEENTGRLVTLVREKAMNEFGKGGSGDKITTDGAPGTGCPVISSLSGTDYAIVVTEPTVSGVHDMERVLDVADHFGVESGIVVNKCDLNEEMCERIEEIAKERDKELLGEIPYDDVFTDAQMEKKTIVEYSDGDTTRAVEEIWKKIEERLE